MLKEHFRCVFKIIHRNNGEIPMEDNLKKLDDETQREFELAMEKLISWIN
jgi:hypothetical protein